jgi:hypothetical protein
LGPTCEVLLDVGDATTLGSLDMLLTSMSERIERTRKGRVWDIWVRGRPIHVSLAESPSVVEMAAGCNQPEDYTILRELAKSVVSALGGVATEPGK